MSRIEDSPGYNDKSTFGKFLGSIGTGLLNSVVPGLGSAVGSVFGSWLGDATGTSSIKRQLNASKELSAYNNELNFNTWQQQFSMQNDRHDFLLRNQTAMQKQGVIDAGLNPAMLNGQLGSVAGVSSPAGGNSSGSSAGSAQNEILPIMQMALQKKQLDIQEKVANADVNLKNAEASLTQSQTSNITKQTDWLDRIYGVQVSSLSQSVQESINRVLNDNARLANENKLTDQQLDESRARVEQIEGIVDLNKVEKDLKSLELDWLPKVYASQVAMNYASGRLSDANAKAAYKSIDVMSENILNLQEQRNLTRETAQKVAAETLNVKANTTYQEFTNNVRQAVGQDSYVTFEKDNNLRAAFDNALTVAKTVEAGSNAITNFIPGVGK